MPNQEKVINRAMCVTYRDNVWKVRMILLPNRELMQAHSDHAVDNPFCMQRKQEWESSGFQNGTVLEPGWPDPHIGGPVSCPGWPL